MTKRKCCAVVNSKNQTITMSGDLVYLCGLPECRQPLPINTYVPLCGAHRAMAEAKSVPVIVDNVIAEYRL